MKDTLIGVDLAKSVFQIHDVTNHATVCKKLTREQFRRYMTKHSACLVVFEACGSAHYWAREMVKLGHEARLIATQYVKPFVKRHSEAGKKMGRAPFSRRTTPLTLKPLSLRPSARRCVSLR